MTGRVHAFIDAFDSTCLFSKDVGKLHKKRVPIKMITDFEQLFDAVLKYKHATEKQLMVNITSIRKS